MLTQQYLSTRGLCRCSCARNHADSQSPPSPHRRFGEIDSSSQSGTAKEEDRKEKETSAHAQGGEKWWIDGLKQTVQIPVIYIMVGLRRVALPTL